MQRTNIASRQFLFGFACFFCFLLLSFVSADAQTHDSSFQPDYILTVTAQNVSFDCQTRYSVIVNGSSPGPTIHMQEGVTTWVRVYNNIADQNLTMHWHGLSQRTAPFSDGTPQVAQWPIPPMHFFDYEVRPNAGDAGTYFYHSHVDFQAISAHGALVVEQCGQPPYQYDDDIVVTLGDFYKKTDQQVVTGLLADPFVWSGETNALLLNGQSGHAGIGNATDASCTPSIINVDPGKTYRMRFIGGTAISLVTLGIECHDNLTVIEADGAYTQPLSIDHLQVASGQRFSVLFATKTADELRAEGRSSYWIQYENRERPANVSGYALLSYNMPPNDATSLPDTLPDTPPISLPRTVYDWLEYALQPLDPTVDPMPMNSTRTVTITMNQIGFANASHAFTNTVQWGLNRDIWKDTRVQTPYLVDVYTRGRAAIPNYDAAIANGGWDPANLAFPARIGEVIDIVWQSNTGPSGGFDVHPFHAHGGHYWDLGSGNGTYDAAANAAKIASLNYTPAKRDTTMVYRYETSSAPNTTSGWRAWRIQVTDAGTWMMHCHILQHMIMGMQTVWVMGDAEQIMAAMPQPYADGYLQFGGSAYGNATTDPIVQPYYGATPGNGTIQGCSGGYRKKMVRKVRR